jgi:RNA-binding protein
MDLSDAQKKYLRGLGHRLKPVVMIGQHGVTDGVVAETGRALADHELIKVRVRLGDRAARDAALGELVARTAATLVQRVGNVALIYLENKELPRILLPDS